MADTPSPDVPDDAAPPGEPPRRSLPRAARLSRLTPGAEPPAPVPPTIPPAPVPPTIPPTLEPTIPPTIEPTLEPAGQPPTPAEPISGGVRVVELVPGAAPSPSPAVLAAQQAAARAAARPASARVTFKPLQDALATRSAFISAFGLLLCFFPVLSLVGLVTGLVARRRIRRSAGQLTGTGSASLGILLGAAGVVIGTTADIVFLLRR